MRLKTKAQKLVRRMPKKVKKSDRAAPGRSAKLRQTIGIADVDQALAMQTIADCISDPGPWLSLLDAPDELSKRSLSAEHPSW